MLIKVRRKHIKKGKCWNPNSCAVALAIWDTIGYLPSVDGESVDIKYLDKRDIPLPRSARRFIRKFDQDKKSVKPFNFILNLERI